MTAPLDNYLAEMRLLREEMDEMRRRMTPTERLAWDRLRESMEFFDGETEIEHGYMVRFMERNYVNRGVS